MKVGLALAGGGLQGIAHIGVIKALQELDIKIVSLLESINAYEEIIIKRIKSIALANEGYAKVITLREDEKYAREHKGKPRPWNLIGEAAGYDEKQCRRIWQDYLNS